MTQTTTRVRAERTDVTPVARARLADADYADAFRIAVDSFRPAGQRARQTFESAPFGLGVVVPMAWRLVLRLRLGPRHGSPDHLLGWRILQDDPDVLVMAASGPLLTARLVIDSTDEQAGVTTLVRYEHASARAIWAVVGIVHRMLAAVLLNSARRRE